MGFERVQPSGKHGAAVPAGRVAITIADRAECPTLAVRLGESVISWLAWKDGQNVDVLFGTGPDAGKLRLEANTEGGIAYTFRAKTFQVVIGSFPPGIRPGAPRSGLLVDHELVGDDTPALIVTLPKGALIGAAADREPELALDDPAPENPKSSDFPKAAAQVKPPSNMEKMKAYIERMRAAGATLPATKGQIADEAGIKRASIAYVIDHLSDIGYRLEWNGVAWVALAPGEIMCPMVTDHPTAAGPEPCDKHTPRGAPDPVNGKIALPVATYHRDFLGVVDWMRNEGCIVGEEPGGLWRVNAKHGLAPRELLRLANDMRVRKHQPMFKVAAIITNQPAVPA